MFFHCRIFIFKFNGLLKSFVSCICQVWSRSSVYCVCFLNYLTNDLVISSICELLVSGLLRINNLKFCCLMEWIFLNLRTWITSEINLNIFLLKSCDTQILPTFVFSTIKVTQSHILVFFITKINTPLKNWSVKHYKDNKDYLILWNTWTNESDFLLF